MRTSRKRDAICELHNSMRQTARAKPPPWFDLHDLRNCCAGHPANKSTAGSTMRSFTALIQSRDKQTGGAFTAALSEMKRKCPCCKPGKATSQETHRGLDPT
jgi:hypothetical protein